MTDSILAWSQLEGAENANSDETINWAEFQDPATVNNSARAMMARIAQWISDQAPKRSSTNVGNAYSVASDAAGATLRDGESITFIPSATNTSACTLNVDGRGAKPWRPAPGVAFVAGNILSGVPVTAYYRLSSDEYISPGTGYYVSAAASGVALQSITARLPQIGDLVVSYAPAPGAGRIRLTESTQAISKSAYPELNSYLSSISYPWGSSATTFNLPPAAGYFLRFAATSTTIDTSGARLAGSTQADQNKTHTHTVNGTTGTESADHVHAVSGTTSPNGAHNHSVEYLPTTGDGGSGSRVATLGSGGSFANTSTASDHTHTFSATSGGRSAAHTHTFSATSAASGSDETRVKNVAFHLDVVASTAQSASQIAVFGFPLQWDTGVNNSDPGSGRVRVNNTTASLATSLIISSTDGLGVDFSNITASLSIGSTVNLSKVGAQANRLTATVSGSPQDNGTWVTIPIVVDLVSGALTNNDQLAFEYARSGFVSIEGALTLANGANTDVALPVGRLITVTGPTGAFSINGFASPIGGREVIIYNSTSQDMTITNDSTSAVANRILTLTGANVTLTGASVASLIYSMTASRWILIAPHG